MKRSDHDEQGQLREEFNRWAEEGRGEEMEEHHLPIVEPTLALMNIQPSDRILDVGCGTGWLGKELAALVPDGQVVGVDVADEMVRRAQQAAAGYANLTFLRGGVDRIPAENDFFTKIISVESAYYWPDPASGLREIFRVLAPGGSVWILINYYRDNPHCHQWSAHYKTPTHLLGADDWARILRSVGFTDVTHRRIPDNSPTPDVYTGIWFKDAEQIRKFKQEGALLIAGLKRLPA
jgi:ubiquinone/menaquinone biosynthesis C-methylase UbiE